MKRIILLLLAFDSFFFTYSQVKRDWTITESRVLEETIFRLPKSEMTVKLSENGYYKNESPPNTYFSLYVTSRVHCSEWKHSKVLEIVLESTYGYKKDFDWLTNERTVDSLFQNLYNWIKEITDFVENGHAGDSVKMKYHYDLNSTLNGGRYFLKLYPSYVIISTDAFLRDQYGYECFRQTKMDVKTIWEFKNRLMKYLKTHNYNIRF